MEEFAGRPTCSRQWLWVPPLSELGGEYGAKVPMAVVVPSAEHPSHRPMLYAMSTYGQEGVERAFQILKVGSCERFVR
jgi:hypothetical protein